VVTFDYGLLQYSSRGTMPLNLLQDTMHAGHHMVPQGLNTKIDSCSLEGTTAV
jgi:hypothetical protein